VQMVVSPPMVDVLCRDMGRMFHYLEYKHDIQIELVEDEHSYINQFSMYDLKGEEITDTFNFS